MIERADDREPQELDDGSEEPVIFRWALLSAVVGTAIRLLENRLGVLARLFAVLGGLA